MTLGSFSIKRHTTERGAQSPPMGCQIVAGRGTEPRYCRRFERLANAGKLLLRRSVHGRTKVLDECFETGSLGAVRPHRHQSLQCRGRAGSITAQQGVSECPLRRRPPRIDEQIELRTVDRTPETGSQQNVEFRIFSGARLQHAISRWARIVQRHGFQAMGHAAGGRSRQQLEQLSVRPPHCLRQCGHSIATPSLVVAVVQATKGEQQLHRRVLPLLQQ